MVADIWQPEYSIFACFPSLPCFSGFCFYFKLVPSYVPCSRKTEKKDKAICRCEIARNFTYKPSHFPLTIRGPRNYFLLRVVATVKVMTVSAGAAVVRCRALQIESFFIRHWITSKARQAEGEGECSEASMCHNFMAIIGSAYLCPFCATLDH